jgi:hypothetical protein
MDATVRAWDIPAGVCLQAMALGAPVTCLSLSPGRDLLATTHVDKRGVFLWSNQLMFGAPGAVEMHAARPVPVGLPSVATGAGPERPHARRGKGKGGSTVAMAVDGAGAADEPSSSDEFYGAGGTSSSSGSEDEAEGSGGGGRRRRGGRNAANGAAEAEDAGPAPYEATDAAGGGAPAPLSPELVTLSLLPRAQWETLLHLDAIKARSKPIEPPKKPEAAPFFLPTVPGLEGNPAFDAGAGGGGEAAAGGGAANGAANGGGKARLVGWGDSDDEGDGGGEEEGGSGSGGEGGGGGKAAAAAARRGPLPGSRVVRSAPGGGGAPVGAFLRLLRAGGAAGDYASFLGHVRGLSPAALDRELRGMILLEGASEREVADVGLLLEALEGEAAAGRNYEFAQALLQHVLAVGGAQGPGLLTGLGGVDLSVCAPSPGPEPGERRPAPAQTPQLPRSPPPRRARALPLPPRSTATRSSATPSSRASPSACSAACARRGRAWTRCCSPRAAWWTSCPTRADAASNPSNHLPPGKLQMRLDRALTGRRRPPRTGGGAGQRARARPCASGGARRGAAPRAGGSGARRGRRSRRALGGGKSGGGQRVGQAGPGVSQGAGR